ncbi:MAG: hypothetical protein JWM86_885 [Thermoleophilia bacterium]|nr:hypothetical protein [Thermoleophilia bacterium]
MQQIQHSPAYAEQHVPNGWGFPTQPLTPQQGMPVVQLPVIGGGAAPATVTRVRWGRLLPVFVAIGLVAFAIWTLTSDSTPSSKAGIDRDLQREVSGGGSGDDVTIADATGGAKAAAAPKVAPPAPAVAAKPSVVRSAAAKRMAARRMAARRAAARRATAATAVAVVAAPSTAAGATAAPRTTTGGGAGSQLPMTGAETWIAATLGILLLAFGIGIHVNAVRIGMTAMLYRRGILLRPVECARLAQERGLPRLRVVLSNVLHRLLEEPASRGSFVAARVGR